jgi:hypothetical protein
MSMQNTKYSIGDYALGGVVVYVDDTEQHGLIVANKDIGYKIPWSYDNTFIFTFTNTDGLYAGKMNTQIIISKQDIVNDVYFLYDKNSLFASYACSIYNNGYSDWYLPSKYELKLIYQYKNVLNEIIEKHNGTQFKSDLYWSSTELDKYNAWSINFKTGDLLVITKNSKIYVRPVRKF